MSVNLNNAITAYRQAAGGAAVPGMDPRDRSDQKDFATVLAEQAQAAVNTMRTAEDASRAAAAGNADLNQVVMAVSEAELTLQTVVAIRDRAVQAYQEILRMPI